MRGASCYAQKIRVCVWDQAALSPIRSTKSSHPFSGIDGGSADQAWTGRNGWAGGDNHTSVSPKQNGRIRSQSSACQNQYRVLVSLRCSILRYFASMLPVCARKNRTIGSPVLAINECHGQHQSLPSYDKQCESVHATPWYSISQWRMRVRHPRSQTVYEDRKHGRRQHG